MKIQTEFWMQLDGYLLNRIKLELCLTPQSESLLFCLYFFFKEKGRREELRGNNSLLHNLDQDYWHTTTHIALNHKPDTLLMHRLNHTHQHQLHNLCKSDHHFIHANLVYLNGTFLNHLKPPAQLYYNGFLKCMTLLLQLDLYDTFLFLLHTVSRALA